MTQVHEGCEMIGLASSALLRRSPAVHLSLLILATLVIFQHVPLQWPSRPESSLRGVGLCARL